MSHFNQVKLKMNDQECLVNALKALGFTVEVHETAQHLFGYENAQREELAEIIVRRKDIHYASNDLGFKLAADGSYSMIISEYDERSGSCAPGKGLGRSFKQNFAMEYAIAKAQSDGYTVQKKVTENGKTKLLVTHGSFKQVSAPASEYSTPPSEYASSEYGTAPAAQSKNQQYFQY